MATVNQLVRKPRARKVAKSNVPALDHRRQNAILDKQQGVAFTHHS